MNKFLILCLICSLLIGVGCNDEDPIFDGSEPSDQEDLSFSDSLLVWQHLKAEDSLAYLFNDPIYHNGIVINHRAGEGGDDDVIYALDSETGELLWSWNDWIEYFSSNSTRDVAIIDNMMFFEARDRTYCIDLISGQTVWKNQSFGFDIRRNILPTNWDQDFIYIAIDQESEITNESFYFHPLDNGIPRKRFTLQSELFELDLMAPTVDVNTHGDTILYFCGYMHNEGTYDGTNGTHTSVFMSAYNITSQDYIWHQDSIAFWNMVRKNPPILLENSVIITTHNKVISFDKQSGTILWEQQFDLSFTSCNYIHADGNIFVRDNLSNTYAIDAHSGNIIWKNDATSSSSCGMIVFEEYLYVGTHNIYIIDINTGELEYTIEPHNKDVDSRSNFLFRIPALSDDGRYIYTSDTFFDICYENPVYR